MDDQRKTKTQYVAELHQTDQEVQPLELSAISGQLPSDQPALSESEKRFRIAQDLSLEAFTILRSVRDALGQIIDFEWTYVNAAAGRILKRAPAELIGRRLLETLPGNRSNKALFERYVRIVESGQGDEVELEYHSETIAGWFRNLAVKLDDGVAVSFSDITQRKQTEEALRQSEKKYQTLFSEMMLGCSLQALVCDEHDRPIDYITLDVNPEFERLMGVTRSAVIGVRASVFLPPAELASWLNVFGPVALTGVPTRYHNYSPLNRKTFEGIVFCPQPGQFAVMFEDVTSRVQSEATIQSQLAEIAAYYDSAPVGLAVLDTQLRYLRVNAKLAAIHGRSAAEHIGKTVDEILPAREAQITAVIEQLQRTGQPIKDIEFTSEISAQPGGTRLWSEGWYPMRDAAGAITGFMITAEDITERKRTEQALRQSQSLLTETERLGHVGGWEFNIDTQLQTWTEEVYRIHEVASTHQPTVIEGVEFYTPDSRPIIERAIQRAVELGEPFDTELEIFTANDNRRWVHVIGKPDLDHRRVFGFFQDITDRKRAEAALRELSRYNRSLIEVSLDPLVTIGWDGKITDVNAATEAATGYARYELIGTNFSSYFTDPARAQAGYEQVFRDGQVRDYELELRHRSGKITSVLYNASVYLDEAGRVLGVFAAARDITDRKRAEQAEHDQRELAEALRDTAEALSSTLNLDEVLDRILISMDRVIAYDAADILLLNDDQTAVHVARHRSHYASTALQPLALQLLLAEAYNLRQMLTTREPVIITDAWQYPGWVQTADNAWIRSNLSLPIMIQNHPIGFLSVDSAQPDRFAAADVERLRAFADQVATAIQNAQLHARIQHYADELEQRVYERTRELADANLRLHELDRLKDEFVARIGHELRTPLTNIKIYLELLDAGKPDKREKYLATLKREAERLHVLIEDLLRVRQLSADAFEPELAPHDINQVIAARLVAWSEQAARHGLEFEARLTADLPLALIDGDYTAQVLGHLISNAINYTPDGTITLSTTSQSDEAGRWVIVSVQDTGPGITAVDLPHIFDQFYRGQAAADYKTPGTGVGLFLSREIVLKMKGRLLVETQVGTGTTFTVWLPVA